MTRCSTSLVIRQTQINTTMSYYIPIRTAKFIKIDVQCWWEHKLVPALGKTIWQHLLKLNTDVLHDLAIHVPGMYHTQLLVCVQQNTCTVMFTVDPS